MIEFILKITFLIWPFGQLLRFNVFGFNLYLLDLFTFFLLFVLVFKKGKTSVKNPIFKPLIIFLSVTSLSLVMAKPHLSSMQFLTAFLYLARLWSYPSIFFALQFVDYAKLKTSLIFSFTIFTLIGLGQYVFRPNMTDLKFLGFDDHYYRLIGSLFDPNFSGLVFSVLTLFLLTQKKWILAVITLISLALTFSRASYLTLIFGLLIFYLFKRPKIVLIGILTLSLFIFLIPKPFGEGVNLFRTFSIFSRLDSLKAGVGLFMQKPILGWGYNTLTNLNGNRIGIDNSFVYIMATSGALGFLSFLNLIFVLFRYTSSSAINKLLTLVLFHSLFNNSFFFIWINTLFWLLAGLSKNLRQEINA